MKQIFEILQEERDRILNIHESATKNQYLNVLLNEEDKELISENSDAYTIDKNNLILKTNKKTQVLNGNFVVLGGITFKPTQKGNLGGYGEIEFTDTGERKKTSIYYICSNKKLYVDKQYWSIYTGSWTRDGFIELCDTLKKKKKSSYGVEQTPGKSVQGYTQAKNYTLKSKDGKQSITIPAKTGYTFKKDKKGNPGATFKLGPTIFGWFGCKSKNFFINNVLYKDEKAFLANNISNAVCGTSDLSSKKSELEKDKSNQTYDKSNSNQSLATNTVVKPTNTAIDAILQKISAGSQKPADANQGPQTFIG